MSRPENRGRAPRQLPPIPIYDLPCSAARFADIPELGAEAVPAATLQHLLDLDADALEAAVEIAIRILDARQGDVDIELDDHDEENGDLEDDRDNDYEQDDADDEDGDEDRCNGHDDIGTLDQGAQTMAGYFTAAQQRAGIVSDAGPGDDTDTEVDVTSPIFPDNLPKGSAEYWLAVDASRAAGWERDDNEDRGGDGS